MKLTEMLFGQAKLYKRSCNNNLSHYTVCQCDNEAAIENRYQYHRYHGHNMCTCQVLKRSFTSVSKATPLLNLMSIAHTALFIEVVAEPLASPAQNGGGGRGGCPCEKCETFKCEISKSLGMISHFSHLNLAIFLHFFQNFGNYVRNFPIFVGLCEKFSQIFVYVRKVRLFNVRFSKSLP